jgi:hypothetical protein
MGSEHPIDHQGDAMPSNCTEGAGSAKAGRPRYHDMHGPGRALTQNENTLQFLCD